MGHYYRGRIVGLGECVCCKLPGKANLGKLDALWEACVWLEKSDGPDEHMVGLDAGIPLAQSVRRKPN